METIFNEYRNRFKYVNWVKISIEPYYVGMEEGIQTFYFHGLQIGLDSFGRDLG